MGNAFNRFRAPGGNLPPQTSIVTIFSIYLKTIFYRMPLFKHKIAQSLKVPIMPSRKPLNLYFIQNDKKKEYF